MECAHDTADTAPIADASDKSYREAAMKRLAYFLTPAVMLCAAASAEEPGDISGEWKSADFIFRFTVAPDGRAHGTLDIPVSGAEDVPIDSVTVSGESVRFSFGGQMVEFQGEFEPGGAAIAGSLTRDGHAVPLRLTLVTRTPAARVARKPAPKEVVDWLRSAAIPIKTTDPSQGPEDLRPFRELVGNARIVSMGEATHGTREFFQLKHRLLEFLVTEMGFTVFALEANWPESLAVNRYVLTGEGDPVEALNGLHLWTVNSQEVLYMVRWMRAYNQDPAHTRKVKFYGFDGQLASAAVHNVALSWAGPTPARRRSSPAPLKSSP